MNPNTSRALASLIIPCWNQIDFTRQCIAALVRHTRAPWELIVVDNGSTDGTRDYLAGVQDAAAVPFTVIANATNRGFPAAINQGLQVARGEYLVLLNNDVVVTDGWLDQLIALTNAGTQSRADGLSPSCCPLPPANPPSQGGEITCSSATDDSPVIAIGAMPSDVALGPATTIGLVGPMSNYAAPPQLVADVSYRDLDEMHAFARQWRDDHRGQWFTTAKLSGFCLLMKRAVYDAVGGLDERFGLGFFDDDDLAERARRAGFGIAVAHDLFVHHFGSRTFVGNGIDTETLLDQNAGRFADKWGVPRAPGRRVALQPFANQRRSDPDDHRLEKQGFLPRSNAEGSGSEGQERLSREQLRGTGDRLAPDSSVSTFRADPRSSALIRGEKPYSSSVRSVAASAIKVSLTMIVRDEEANLPHCLESARGLFDEIVVVDTGSTDRTKEIALEFGARVFDFVWIDDFAAACNAALEHATGDYAFWLDADDVIDPGEREKLRRLLDSLGATDADCLAHLVDSNGVGAVTPPPKGGGKLNIVSGNLGDMSGDSDGAGAVTPPGPPSERGESWTVLREARIGVCAIRSAQ